MRICGCCGSETIPPTPGTDEEGFYCEPCGIAWADPEALSPWSCVIHRDRHGKDS